MDFSLSAADEAFRLEVRAWLQEHYSGEFMHLSRQGLDDAESWGLRVRWEQELASGGWVGIRVDRDEAEVRVCVEDRGPGVLSADLKRLFEPFFRGSHSPVKKGHGLGLAIARQVVVNHHGRIEVENRREGGLRLTVRLPSALPGTSA